MSTKVCQKNGYMGKRYRQISRRRVIDTVGIKSAFLKKAVSGSIPSSTKWTCSGGHERTSVQRTPLPHIDKFTQKTDSQVTSLRMPGGLSLSRYTRVYNSGDGRLPGGQLTNMPGYLIEPHRARCAPDLSGKEMTLTAGRNSVTYVHRHSLHSRALPHNGKPSISEFKRPASKPGHRHTITADLYPSDSFASRYVYAKRCTGEPVTVESLVPSPEPIPAVGVEGDHLDVDELGGECLYESDGFDDESSNEGAWFGRSERPLAPEKLVHARRRTPSPSRSLSRTSMQVTPRYNPDRHRSIDVTCEDIRHSQGGKCGKDCKGMTLDSQTGWAGDTSTRRSKDVREKHSSGIKRQNKDFNYKKELSSSKLKITHSDKGKIEKNWKNSSSDWNNKNEFEFNDKTDTEFSIVDCHFQKPLVAYKDEYKPEVRLISATGSGATVVRSPVSSGLRTVSVTSTTPGLTSALTSPSPSYRQLSEYRHQLELDDGRTALTTLSDIGSEISDSPLSDKWSP